MSDVQKQLDTYAKTETALIGGDPTCEQAAPEAFGALQAVLDKCSQLETDDFGAPSYVGKAFADTDRGLIADALPDA